MLNLTGKLACEFMVLGLVWAMSGDICEESSRLAGNGMLFHTFYGRIYSP